MSIVGTLQAEHSVDPNGSLNLNVAIQVPPAKLGPDISVFYHSAITEMSVLGVGWELEAFGIIQRVGATIAQDGFSGKPFIFYYYVDQSDGYLTQAPLITMMTTGTPSTVNESSRSRAANTAPRLTSGPKSFQSAPIMRIQSTGLNIFLMETFDTMGLRQ
jgi:hypothetical protein